MSDKYIGVQLKFSGGNPSPIISSASNNGTKRLTLLNLVKLIWAMAHGSLLGAGTNQVMVQDTLVAAHATVTPVAPTVGQTVSIGGTALTAQQARARAVIDPDTSIAGDTFTLGGYDFTAVAGAATLGDPTFSIDTSNTATATSIAAQVSAYGPLAGLVGAFVTSTDECTFYALTPGTAGNAITLVSSDGSTLPVTGGGFLAGGAAIANNKFDFGVPDTVVGTSLAAAINASTTAAINQTKATVAASTGVVTITAKVAGPAGNAVTLTSSDGGTLAVTGSGFLASGSAGAPVQWFV